MQSLRPNPNAIYQNVIHALKTITQKEGGRTVIRGVNIVIAGAGPAHGVYFASYEMIRTALGNVRSTSGHNNPAANGKNRNKTVGSH
jgi:solute carrier family 25 iron transporter 28/37